MSCPDPHPGGSLPWPCKTTLQVRSAQWPGWKIIIHGFCSVGFVFRQVIELMQLTLRHKGSSRELIKGWDQSFWQRSSLGSPSDDHEPHYKVQDLLATQFYDRVPNQHNKQLQRNTNKQGKQSRLLSWLQFSPKKFWLDGYTKGTHLFSSIHIVLYVYMFQPFSC